MKHIKKFETLQSANGFITPKPFVGSVHQGNAVIQTNQVSQLVIENNKIDTAIIITGTWDPTITNSTKKVIISGNVELNGKADCYSITFETGAHLTLNPGSRLRIWQGGITNNDAESISYFSLSNTMTTEDFADMAQLLIHPDVNVNRSPMATVSFASKGYSISSNNYAWQRFAVPTSTYTTRFDIIKPNPAGYLLADNVNQTWVTLADSDHMDAFSAFETSCTATSPGDIYTMTINLLTNNFTLTHYHNTWLFFANSYTAKMNGYKLLAENKLYNLEKFTNSNPITDVDITSSDKYINPMMMFTFKCNADVVLNYKELVWDFSFELDEQESNILLSLPKGTRGLSNQGKLELDEFPMEKIENIAFS